MILWWKVSYAHVASLLNEQGKQCPPRVPESNWKVPVVYGYGNFAIQIQSETFSQTPYPIQIRKLKIMGSVIQFKSETAHSDAR